MFLHDHKIKTEPMYCTLMKEICHEGWTKSMGQPDSETGKKPRCHKWVSVFINDPKATPPIAEVFDCNERWSTDLQQQVAQEIYQNAAATESVRNHVAEGNGISSVIRSFFMQLAEAAGQKLQIPEQPKPERLPPPQENGEQNGQRPH